MSFKTLALVSGVTLGLGAAQAYAGGGQNCPPQHSGAAGKAEITGTVVGIAGETLYIASPDGAVIALEVDQDTMLDGRELKKGDRVFFYHSSTEPPAIVGIAEVARDAYPDPTALDPKHDHFDPKSKADAPSWYQVDIKAVEPLPRPLSLAELRAAKGLEQ